MLLKFHPNMGSLERRISSFQLLLSIWQNLPFCNTKIEDRNKPASQPAKFIASASIDTQKERDREADDGAGRGDKHMQLRQIKEIASVVNQSDQSTTETLFHHFLSPGLVSSLNRYLYFIVLFPIMVAEGTFLFSKQRLGGCSLQSQWQSNNKVNVQTILEKLGLEQVKLSYYLVFMALIECQRVPDLCCHSCLTLIAMYNL